MGSEVEHQRRQRRSAGASSLLIMLCATLAFSSGVNAQTPAYTIGPEDVLSVTVFNQPDLTGKFAVGADGAVSFPMVGSLRAAGLTLREFEAMLVGKLAENILRHPQVQVTVDTYRSQQFHVIGEVRQPGTYYLTGHETLIQAIARAGYTTADAGGEILVVRPRQPGAATGPVRPEQAGAANELLRVDLDKLSAGTLDDNLSVRNGDTIFVPVAETAFVLGQVRTPGPYRIKRAMTVQQFLSMAGGVTERGDAKRMKVTRLVNGRKQDVKITLSDLVLPNDTITVPEKWF